MGARTKDQKLYFKQTNENYDYSCQCKMKHGKSAFQIFSMFLTENSFYFIRAGGFFSKDIIINYKAINMQYVNYDTTNMTINFKYRNDDKNIIISFLNAEDFNRILGSVKQRQETEKQRVKDTPSENKPSRNIYYDYLVVGPYDLNEMVNAHIKQHKNRAYGGDTKTKLRSVLRNYPRIYKYNQMRSKKVKLVKEDENEIDNNAVAVYFRNNKVGYIQKDYTNSVRHNMDAGHTPYAKIFSGPYAEFDEWENKVVEVDNDFRMTIAFD